MKEINIQLDSPIEEKGMFDQIEFNKIFEITQDYKVLLKKTKTVFTGVLKVKYVTGENFGTYNYIQGKQEGEQINFFKNGNIHTQLSMLNGKYHKEYKIFYENGKIQTNSLYEDGIQLSLASYYKNGIKNTVFINDYKGVKKEEKRYYDTGVLKKHRIRDKDFIQVINYYENKNKKSEGKESKKHRAGLRQLKIALWKYYDEEGKIKEEGNWSIGGVHGKDNIQTGIWKMYNGEGELIGNRKFNEQGNSIK